MRLSISLNNFKKNHKKKNNQAIYFDENCKDYTFIENLYKFILVKKNSFIFFCNIFTPLNINIINTNEIYIPNVFVVLNMVYS